jgi:hypothetical protein
MNIIRHLTQLLRETADKIEAGDCEIDDEQALKIIGIIAHQPLSKEQAAIHLHMSTSKFDVLVKEGWLPKGRKKLGWKEKIWYEDEIDKCMERMKE